MTSPIYKICDPRFPNGWCFPHDEDKTLRQNFDEVAQCVVDEVLTGIDAQIETDGLAIGCLYVSLGLDDTHVYFRLDDLAREAAYRVATNYSFQHRDEHTEDTKRHMTAVRDAFKAALDILDAAVEDPTKFEEFSEGKPIDPEQLKYIKQMCEVPQ